MVCKTTARIKSYIRKNDFYKHNISILTFKSYDAAKRCYDSATGKIKFNDLSIMLYETLEAEHINIENGKYVLILRKIDFDLKNNLIFYEVLCEGKIFWVNEFNLDII